MLKTMRKRLRSARTGLKGDWTVKNKNPIDRIFNEFNKVLKYYTCPDSCDSICCKYSPIQIEKFEYPIILNTVDQISKEIIEAKSQPASDYGFYKELPAVCPLLEGNRCTIYQARPLVCQRYPFEVTDDRRIVIRPCALGIDLILDYIIWSNDTESAKELYEDLKTDNKEMPKNAFVMGPFLKGVPRKFIQHLNKMKYEDRKRAREDLIKQIE